jgi:prepilin-type N-terminal cleavage/methylation domain-containing protein
MNFSECCGRSFKRGFTLIELLVVIAIIALLASIILVSLGSARSRSADTRTLSDIRQLNNLIQNDASGPSDFTNSFSAADTATTSSKYQLLIDDIAAQGNTFSAKTNASAPFNQYAIYATSIVTPGSYFCMDSTGYATTSDAVNTGVTCGE